MSRGAGTSSCLAARTQSRMCGSAAFRWAGLSSGSFAMKNFTPRTQSQNMVGNTTDMVRSRRP